MSERHGRSSDALPDAIEEAVLAALELDDAERDAALAALLQREPGHAEAIRRWLQSAGVLPDATIVAAPATPAPGDPDDETSDPPRRLGPYHIVRRLGRGGFGSVFLAERQGMGQPVAVKLLNPGMESREVLRRFAAEREALLRMDHSGIARCLDAGATAAGRPYFVMEYVPGDPLLVHCRRRQLDLQARLQLFLLVLDAVAHAHQKGVIHRDLSANNVLVAGDGDAAQPKIIDFGIAKSLAAPLADGPLTFQGTLMGTPEFMSPEQALGQIGAIDTRTDVYSLGVQLYELLADQLPVPAVVLRSQGVAGMAQVIKNHQPARPSQIAPRSLQGRLRGDLDAIAMKAIAKERDDRYASAADFAADLRRHLAHEPVFASPPDTWYLLRKFARRHVGQVAAATVGLLLLVLALLFSVSSWQEARAARTELQRVHDELARKTAAGFRLLASQQRLRSAVTAARRLDPPWPERLPAMQQWLRDFGEPLRALAPELARMRGDLAARKAALPDAALDPLDEDLLQSLLQMETELHRFLSRDGTLAAVERGRTWAENVVAPALHRSSEAWTATASELRRDRGFQLAPQPGLVPLGRNPATALFEFLDLASHPKGAPMPVRDAAGLLHAGAPTGIVFVLLPAGTLRLGARSGEPGLAQNDAFAADDELNGKNAMLTDFFCASTELTRAQWAALTNGEEPAQPLLPACEIDWEEAQAALQHFGMALPSEAQWEYACRAGSVTPWFHGVDLAAFAAVGHVGGPLQAVALLRPNPFGLYDVHGNASEWCADWMADYRSTTLRTGDGLQLLPPPARLPDLRAVRGGSAMAGPLQARSSARAGRLPGARDAFLGLRPVRAIVRAQ